MPWPSQRWSPSRWHVSWTTSWRALASWPWCPTRVYPVPSCGRTWQRRSLAMKCKIRWTTVTGTCLRISRAWTATTRRRRTAVMSPSCFSRRTRWWSSNSCARIRSRRKRAGGGGTWTRRWPSQRHVRPGCPPCPGCPPPRWPWRSCSRHSHHRRWPVQWPPCSLPSTCWSTTPSA